MSKNDIKMQFMAYVLSLVDICMRHKDRIIFFLLGSGSMAGGFWMLREALRLKVTTSNENYSSLVVGGLALLAIIFAVLMLSCAFSKEVKDND